MLARLEKAYLNILRVFILIAASIALIVACLAIISSAPFFASQLGFRGEAQGGDLARFMEEQRDYGSSSDYDADTGYSRTFTISGSLQETAKRLSAYAKTHHSIDLSTEKIEKSLAAAQEEFPLEYYGDYEESWETLSKQLAVAEGKPLSMEKLDELTIWHDQNFRMAMAEKEASKDEQLLGALTAFGTAGGAFIVFVFLVFCFIFVRIERNLRLVRVAITDPDANVDED